jgi:hypothetical protein
VAGTRDRAGDNVPRRVSRQDIGAEAEHGSARARTDGALDAAGSSSLKRSRILKILVQRGNRDEDETVAGAAGGPDERNILQGHTGTQKNHLVGGSHIQQATTSEAMHWWTNGDPHRAARTLR